MKDIYWIRSNIKISNIQGYGSLIFSTFYLTSAAEIWWDGHFLGANGIVGSTLKEEIPGKVKSHIRIPQDMVRPGEHTIAIRLSSFVYKPPRIDSIKIGPEEAFRKAALNYNNVNVFITAFFISAALLNVILYFGYNRNLAYLFLFLYCAFHTFKILLLPSWLFQNVNMADIRINERLLYLFVMLGGISLIAFLVYKFPLRRKKWLLFTVIILSGVSYFMIPERVYFPLVVGAAFIISIYGAARKFEDSLLVLLGLAGLSFGAWLWHRDIFIFGYFAGIMFFIVFMNIALAFQIARQNRLHHEAKLRSARLENQLFKKSIQPHFIMNSLTSLQELIETEPARALELIDALADEFHQFSKISGEKLVPISDELAICRAHLKIMSFRKGGQFRLDVNGLNGDEKVPPGIFHTLIENGLSHGYRKKKSGYFSLSKEDSKNGVCFVMTNDGDVADASETTSKGTGMKYIEARLEESFPGRWKLESSPFEKGWRVAIEIHNFKSERI